MTMLVDEEIEIANPFPGLRPFEEDEEHLFFGREGQSDELVMRLARTRFLAVVGSSGSGKSSLVRCGLLPSLYGGYMASAGSAWRVAIFRPSDDPIGNLAEALAHPEVLGSENAPMAMQRGIVESTLRRSERGVIDAFKQARLKQFENLLIIADQFEELFRFSSVEKSKGQTTSDSTSFVNLLLTAARESGIKIYVVLTMRSDFLGHCTEFRGLPEAINDGQYLIPRMNREERRAAITGPIAVSGAEISARLVTKLLNDVGDNPDQLPILQHALMRTWGFWSANHKEGEPLDLVHYEAIGTMSSALSQHAEEAFAEIKGEEDQHIVEVIFKALTDKSSHSLGIRRPTKLDELISLADSNKEKVVEILEVFRKPGRSFIMPPAGMELHHESVIDISHESFMRVWERLVKWVDEEAQAAETYTRLAEAAMLYQLGKSGIWRDPELSIALRWRKENNPNSTWARRYNPTFERAVAFLDYSKEQSDFEIEQKEKQQKLRMRRARIFAIVLGLASLLTLFAAIWAYKEKQKADANAIEANVQRQNAETQQEKAEEATEEAIKERKKAELERERAESEKERAEKEKERADEQRDLAKLHEKQAVAQTQLAVKEKKRAERQTEIADSNKQVADLQRAMAERNQQEALRRKALAESRNLAFDARKALIDNQVKKAKALALEAYNLNKDNGGPGQNNDIYQALHEVYRHKKGSDLVYFEQGAPLKCISRSPQGDQFVTGDEVGSIHLLSVKDDALSGEELTAVKIKSGIRALSFSNDGKSVLVATFDQWLYRIDLGSKTVTQALKLETLPQYIAPVAENAYVLAGSNQLSIITDNQGKLSTTVSTRLSGITAAHFSNGVLAIAQKEKLSLFQIPENEIATSDLFSKVSDLSIPSGIISSLYVSSTGDEVLIGTEGGRLYRAGTANAKILGPYTEHKSGITAIESGSAREMDFIASSGLDKKAMILPAIYLSNSLRVEGENEPIELIGHDKWVMGCSLSHGSEYLITISDDRKVRLWFTNMDDLAKKVSEL